MQATVTMAGRLGTTPFVLFDQDVDEVIMLMNFYMRLGAGTNGRPAPVAVQNDREESAAFWAAL